MRDESSRRERWRQCKHNLLARAVLAFPDGYSGRPLVLCHDSERQLGSGHIRQHWTERRSWQAVSTDKLICSKGWMEYGGCDHSGGTARSRVLAGVPAEFQWPCFCQGGDIGSERGFRQSELRSDAGDVFDKTDDQSVSLVVLCNAYFRGHTSGNGQHFTDF